jgi:hypothetical protein
MDGGTLHLEAMTPSPTPRDSVVGFSSHTSPHSLEQIAGGSLDGVDHSRSPSIATPPGTGSPTLEELANGEELEYDHVLPHPLTGYPNLDVHIRAMNEGNEEVDALMRAFDENLSAAERSFGGPQARRTAPLAHFSPDAEAIHAAPRDEDGIASLYAAADSLFALTEAGTWNGNAEGASSPPTAEPTLTHAQRYVASAEQAAPRPLTLDAYQAELGRIEREAKAMAQTIVDCHATIADDFELVIKWGLTEEDTALDADAEVHPGSTEIQALIDPVKAFIADEVSKLARPSEVPSLYSTIHIIPKTAAALLEMDGDISWVDEEERVPTPPPVAAPRLASTAAAGDETRSLSSGQPVGGGSESPLSRGFETPRGSTPLAPTSPAKVSEARPGSAMSSPVVTSGAGAGMSTAAEALRKSLATPTDADDVAAAELGL